MEVGVSADSYLKDHGKQSDGRATKKENRYWVVLIYFSWFEDSLYSYDDEEEARC